MSDEGKKEAAKESKGRVGCVSRGVYIALVVVLIFSFAAGTIYLLWVQPTTAANQSLTAQLAAADAELGRLRPQATENAQLSAQVRQSTLRLLVLGALVDVNAGRVSLAQGETASAVTRLSAIEADLANLHSRLEGDQAASVAQMQDRLSLIQGEVASDSFAAQRDLEVLANALSQLAEALAGG
jgi:hypothetical protein